MPPTSFDSPSKQHCEDLGGSILKLLEIIGRPKIEVDFEHFIDLYKKEKIEEDRKELARLKAIFKKDSEEGGYDLKYNQMLGRTFEVLVRYCISKKEWLGKNVEIVPVSEFDDVKNGIDILLKFIQAGNNINFLALGIDLTMSHHLFDKLNRIKSEIDQGHLAKMDYFLDGNHKGQVSNIPRTIVGIDKDLIVKLMESITTGMADAVNDKKIKYLILRESEIQLEIYQKYALNRSKIESEKAKELMKAGRLEEAQKTLELSSKQISIAEKLGTDLRIVLDLQAKHTDSMSPNTRADILDKDTVFKEMQKLLFSIFQY
ncbi:MAG: hypothetical protein WCF94_02555 [bacterium]